MEKKNINEIYNKIRKRLVKTIDNSLEKIILFKKKKEPLFTQDEYNSYYTPNWEFNWQRLNGEFEQKLDEVRKGGNIEEIIKLCEIASKACGSEGHYLYWVAANIMEKSEMFDNAIKLYRIIKDEFNEANCRMYKHAKEQGIYDQTFGFGKKMNEAISEKNPQEAFKKINVALGYLGLQLHS